MFTKPSKFRDSETVPDPTQMSQKISARTSEVASPVQFLSNSEDNLSPALINPFQKLPALKQTYQHNSSDDEDSLHVNVSNPLLKKWRVLLSSPSNSDTDTDPEQKKMTHRPETISLAQNISFLGPSTERIEKGLKISSKGMTILTLRWKF